MSFRLFLWAIFSICFSFAQEINHEHDTYFSLLENKGQWPADVLFKSKFEGGNLWVNQSSFLFQIQDFSRVKNAHFSKDVPAKKEVFNQETYVWLNFKGANSSVVKEKNSPSLNYYNFYLGNDSTLWKSGVKSYDEVVLEKLYTGVDLKLIATKGELKYEFYIAPQADPKQIVLEWNNQQKLSVDKKGNLIIESALGKIIEEHPYSYQIINGSIREVKSAFKLINEHEVIFELGAYNPAYTLVIDPKLVFATYSGSISDNFGMSATYAHDGKGYSAGTVFGNAYPMPAPSYNTSSSFSSAVNVNYGITDVFISKYAADGTTMLWSTYLGGGTDTQGTETVHSMICDSLNNLFLFGATSSTDFPIQGGYQSSHGGGTNNTNFYFNGVYFNTGVDLYVAKISADGKQLLASTYMGGSGNDGVNYMLSAGDYSSPQAYDSLTHNYGDTFRGEIMLDEKGNCIVASSTRSTNFPVKNPIQSTNAGAQDGVIFRLNNSLSQLEWSTYFGGVKNDACYSVKIDSNFQLVFSGGTNSPNLAGMNGWITTFQGGVADGFVGKINPKTNTLIAASYIGTTQYDQTYFVEIDHFNNVYLLGQSQGGLFPIVNANFSNVNSGQFICKLTPDLKQIMNSTTFGNGNNLSNISPAAFLVDVCGNMYVSGWGSSVLGNQPALNGMPITSDAFRSTPPNGFDFYLMVLDRTFNHLIYGSYIGGNQSNEHVDGGTSRFDRNGIVYQSVCAGCGKHSDFPTFPNPGAWSNVNKSDNCNNVLFKFDFGIIPNAQFSVDQVKGCVDFEVQFNNQSSVSDSYLWIFDANDTVTNTWSPNYTFKKPGDYTVKLITKDSICNLMDTANILIQVKDSIQLAVSPGYTQCISSLLPFIAYTNHTATQFIWSTNSKFTDTLNTNLADSSILYKPDYSGFVYVKAENGYCEKVDSIPIQFEVNNYQVLGKTTFCGVESAQFIYQTNLDTSDYELTWSAPGAIYQTLHEDTMQFVPNQSGVVYIHVKTKSGCQFDDSLHYYVGGSNLALNQLIVDKKSVPIGGVIHVQADPVNLEYYSWSCSTCSIQQPSKYQTGIKINQSTIVTLIAGDSICVDTLKQEIVAYSYNCDDPYVFVPSAFSPNGDQQNDVLYVLGDMIGELTFRVFDRWGELVFETTDRSIGWDGVYKGRKLEPDVYDYYLQAICIDGVKTIKKGNITLLK